MSTNDPASSNPPAASTEPGHYSVAPEEARPAVSASAPRGRIDKPGLTADFPEDADFDHDPELTKVITGKAGTRDGSPAPGSSGATFVGAGTHPTDFIPTGLGPPLLWAIIGGVLLVIALVFTGINAPDKTAYRILLRLYTVALHTGTGVVALYVAAALMRQIVGRIDLAASRMFAGVAAFAAVFSLTLHLTPSPVVDNAARVLLAGLAYLAIVAVTFRLWNRQTLGYVVGGHFVLWLVVQIAMLLSTAIVSK